MKCDQFVCTFSNPNNVFRYLGSIFHFDVVVKDLVLTIEWPKYSAALSDIYSNFPFCVSIIKNPDIACENINKSHVKNCR